ncbi:hypothetical protein C823_006780 [Eubacterium plexicaudatum ASF492]|uniref:Uncharacterized protein n=1 Tax=Eubacterium plexicaudatum ASF492 TaxID=1235802 RepID=N2ACH9_9FIRM|nr:hypothetical protein C823_006780 [Eubacterium plexicaudatum ASF492]
MDGSNVYFTLFSSDSTIKYKKDILNVLAAPENGIYHFRYEDKYVQSDAQTMFQNWSHFRMAIVAFRSGSNANEDEQFIVPIRWVEIIETELVADFYTITFRIKKYPRFSTDFENNSHQFSGINEKAKNYFEISREHKELSVRKELLPYVNPDYKQENDSNWLKIVKALSLIHGYDNFHFLRCSPLCVASKKCGMQNEFTILEESKYTYLKVDYYQSSYDPGINGKIHVDVNPDFITVASGIGNELESRYDSVKISFQAKKSMNNSLSEINIYTTGLQLETKINIPVKIVKNKSSKFFHALIMALGAFVVGLPGILENNIEWGYKVIISLAGAMIMIVSNYIETKE